MDSQQSQINIIRKSLAIAEEISHQLERDIHCEGELAYIIDKVRRNIEETASILDTEDLLRSKSIIENSIIQCVTEYCKYFEKIEILTEFLLQAYDIFSTFGMTIECEHVSMISDHIREGIRSSEELNYILNEVDWITHKLGVVSTQHNERDFLSESYYSSRSSRVELEMALSEYIGVLEEHRNMFESLLHDALPY